MPGGVAAGRCPERLPEAACQVALIVKAGPIRRLRWRNSLRQEPSRPVDAHHHLVPVRRHAHLLVKDAYQVVRTEPHALGQRSNRYIALGVRIEPLPGSRNCRMLSTEADQGVRRREVGRGQPWLALD